jgi:hypothetical protein
LVTPQPDSGANELEPRVDAAGKPGEQWLTAALEEYRSLRIEIIDAIEAQRKIMQLGVTALSVLIGLGLQRISPLLTVTLLTLLVPTVAIFITAGALGELFRAARASSFFAYREPIINRAVSGSNPALEWEEWLRRGSIFVLRDRAEFLALFSLTAGALSLGFYTLFTTPTLHAAQSTPLVMTLVTISIGLWITCGILHFYLVRKARRQFSMIGTPL